MSPKVKGSRPWYAVRNVIRRNDMKIMKDHLNAAGLRVEGKTNDWVTTTCSRIDGWVDWWMHVGSNLRRTVEIYRLNSESTVTVLDICVGLFSFRLLHLFLFSVPFFNFSFYSHLINLASITPLLPIFLDSYLSTVSLVSLLHRAS